MKFNPQEKSTCWSVTINNPIANDEENINEARQKGWTVKGQKEEGEKGTFHYQLMVKTPHLRGSAIKKQFPRAHIEIARDKVALEKYVHKEETRVGELQTTDEMYPSMQKLWDIIVERIEERSMPGVERSDWCSNQYRHVTPDKRLEAFDRCIRILIGEGYCIETVAVNPQVRCSVKLFGEEIYVRSKIRLGVRRQTDRQTDKLIVPVIDITNAPTEEENSVSAKSEGNEGSEVVKTDEESGSEDS